MPRPITTEEMTALQFATVRESCGRRSWPGEVVEAFLAAEVIRDREERRTEPPRRDRAAHHPTVNRPARFGVLMYD